MEKLKQMLMEYTCVADEVSRRNDELNKIIQSKYDINVTAKLTGMPCARGGTSDPTIQAVEKIVDKYDVYVDRLSREIDELINTRESVNKLLKALSPTEKAVIDLRYFKRRRWTDVGIKVGYSKRQVQRIHGDAMQKMLGKMENK